MGFSWVMLVSGRVVLHKIFFASFRNDLKVTFDAQSQRLWLRKGCPAGGMVPNCLVVGVVEKKQHEGDVDGEAQIDRMI